VIISTINIVLDLVRSYGVEKFNFLHDFFPVIQKLSSSSFNDVRALVIQFYQEAYIHLGNKIAPYLKMLKKPQAKILEEKLKQY
jgi:hypothetical protein